MKLNNKFLLIAAVVTVLPLSVANAVEEPTSSNGPAPLVNKGPYAENGPGLVNEKPVYGEKTVEPAVQPALPEYKVPSTAKNTVQNKNVQKALPKTSAVK